MKINGDVAMMAVEMLKENEDFNDMTFLLAHENEIKPTPLTKPIVAVSVKGCKIGDRIKKVTDAGEIITTLSRPIDVTLSIDIYLPYSMGGINGHKIFDRIATYLIYEREVSVSTVTCGSTEYDKSTQAIVLRTAFVYHTELH